MAHDFTLIEMLKAGWWISTILLVLSIFSITTILERLHVLRRARLDASSFTAAVLDRLNVGAVSEAIAYCERFHQPLARVVRAVLLTSGERADKERVLLHTLRMEVRCLETHVPFLGTVGSIAPFIGLFGTITGIIRAFREIVLRGSGGLEVVAGGIAEALVTTAVGLIVAIPAVVGYNFCLIRIRRLAEEIELYAYQVIEAGLRR